MPKVNWNVREIAKARGIHTATELAERADVNINTAAALFKGRSTRVDRETLAKLCQTLDCTPGDLLVYDPNGQLRGSRVPVGVGI